MSDSKTTLQRIKVMISLIPKEPHDISTRELLTSLANFHCIAPGFVVTLGRRLPFETGSTRPIIISPEQFKVLV